jgi:hypothetical protein
MTTQLKALKFMVIPPTTNGIQGEGRGCVGRLYVNDMPTPSRNVGLALYADDTAIIATSHQPTLLVSYLQTVSDLQRWLAE